ncbi:SPOR domain-containing protein [Aeromonas tecta]|uniref:SPOR domain-containing protein n=1 Tax=Aeromonas tecta TaxID=324617 RepID=UPI000680C693|nr:hypothetical protein [Aeromonas tecta]
MTERYLCKPSHLIRQLTLGLAAGALVFFFLSNAIPSAKRNTTTVIANSPMLRPASEPNQPQVSRASVWVLVDKLALPLPGLVSDAEYVARWQEHIAEGVTPVIGKSVGVALPNKANGLIASELSTVAEPIQQARIPVVDAEVSAERDVAAKSKAVPAPKAKPQGDEPGSITLTPARILNQKDSRHLSVQLMGAGRLDAIERFVVGNQLSGKVWVYRTQLHGYPWYVVLQGDHASMTLAMAAIRNLPATLLKAKPWPKSFAQVKKELKQ